MTDTALAGASADSAAAKRPARTSRPAAKPHGQWKVDGKTPLNANETWKQEDDGLNVRERIETIYSKEGFDALEASGKVIDYFRANFPAVVPDLITESDLLHQFNTNEHLPLISIKCTPYHYKDAGVIVGDAEANTLLRRPYRAPWVHPEPDKV